MDFQNGCRLPKSSVTTCVLTDELLVLGDERGIRGGLPRTTATGVPNISWFSIACPPGPLLYEGKGRCLTYYWHRGYREGYWGVPREAGK